MGWLSDIFSKVYAGKMNRAAMLSGYVPIFSSFGRDIYASDVVEQAVSCIVHEMKKLTPAHVVENGMDVTPMNDSRQRVLMNPNQIMTKSAFIEKIFWMLLKNYNAYVIPVYDVYKDANGTEKRLYRALYPVQPSQVTFFEGADNRLYIEMQFPNAEYKTTLPYSDVIHLRFHYSDSEFLGGDASGNPNHDALIKTLQINEDLTKGVASAMKSSFAINGVVKYNTAMDKGKTEAALKELEEKILTSKSGFLPLDLKAEYIPITKEVQMVDAETLKFIDEKILRTWGVPLPILKGDYTPQQYEAFYQKTLEPLIVSLCDEFTRVLFTERERSFGHAIKFYPKNLVFMSMDQTIEMVRLLGDSGSLYENEKRIAFGLLPLPELVGVRMQSLNYVDVNIADKYQVGGSSDEQE